MTDSEANFYVTGNASGREARRLQKLTLPSEFSLSLLDIKPLSTVLDVGAGTNIGTGMGVKAAGGTYFAMDVWPEALTAQAEVAQSVYRGSVADLVFDSRIAAGQFNVAHARSVLCHLPAHQRVQAIQGLLRVSSDQVALVEYRGSSVGGSPGADKFRAVLNGIARHSDLTFQPFMEYELLSLAKQAVGSRGYVIEERTRYLPADNRFQELILAGNSVIRHSLLGDRRLGIQMAEAVVLLEEEQDQYNRVLREDGIPRPIRGPDLVAVLIQKT